MQQYPKKTTTTTGRTHCNCSSYKGSTLLTWFITKVPKSIMVTTGLPPIATDESDQLQQHPETREHKDHLDNESCLPESHSETTKQWCLRIIWYRARLHGSSVLLGQSVESISFRPSRWIHLLQFIVCFGIKMAPSTSTQASLSCSITHVTTIEDYTNLYLND